MKIKKIVSLITVLMLMLSTMLIPNMCAYAYSEGTYQSKNFENANFEINNDLNFTNCNFTKNLTITGDGNVNFTNCNINGGTISITTSEGVRVQNSYFNENDSISITLTVRNSWSQINFDDSYIQNCKGIINFDAYDNSVLYSNGGINYNKGKINFVGYSTLFSKIGFYGNEKAITIERNDGEGRKGNLYSNGSIKNCTFDGNNSVIINNNTTSGSGVAEFEIADSNFKNSTNTALYLNTNISSIKGCNFYNNKGTNGGALYYIAVRTADVENCNFSYNSASKNGGAVYIEGNRVDFINCGFKNNSASKNGGGVYSNDSIHFENCTFTNNNASNGGGSYSDKEVFTYETDFKQNNVLKSGGALFSEASVQSESSDYYYNTADENGGAISSLGDITVTDGIISGNSAENGGAIGITNEKTMEESISGKLGLLVNSPIKMDIGSGESNNSELERVYKNNVEIENTKFSLNSATNSGGAIYMPETELSNLYAVGCKFTNNSSENSGGAIYTIKGTELSDNFRGHDSMTASDYSLNNVAISGDFNSNTSKDGGAIYLKNKENSLSGSLDYDNYGFSLNNYSEVLKKYYETINNIYFKNKEINTASEFLFHILGYGSADYCYENDYYTALVDAGNRYQQDNHPIFDTEYIFEHFLKRYNPIVNGVEITVENVKDYTCYFNDEAEKYSQYSGFEKEERLWIDRMLLIIESCNIDDYEASFIKSEIERINSGLENDGYDLTKTGINEEDTFVAETGIGSFQISLSSTFENNVATSKGGAVYTDGKAGITGTYENNIAEVGGAVCGETLDVRHATFDDNNATKGEAVCCDENLIVDSATRSYSNNNILLNNNAYITCDEPTDELIGVITTDGSDREIGRVLVQTEDNKNKTIEYSPNQFVYVTTDEDDKTEYKTLSKDGQLILTTDFKVDYIDSVSGQLLNSQIKKYDENLILECNTDIEKPEYSFLGWFDENGNEYLLGEAYAKNENLTLYAKYSSDIVENTTEQEENVLTENTDIEVSEIKEEIKTKLAAKTGGISNGIWMLGFGSLALVSGILIVVSTKKKKTTK